MRRLKLLDYIVIALGAAAIAVTGIYAYSGRGAASHVRIQADGAEWIYSLDHNRVAGFSGPIGETLVEIRDETVWVVSSPCREQTCVNRGNLGSGGDWTACMPNRVFVHVIGDKIEKIDAVSY